MMNVTLKMMLAPTDAGKGEKEIRDISFALNSEHTRAAGAAVCPGGTPNGGAAAAADAAAGETFTLNMNSELKMMDFVLVMMDFDLEVMDFVLESDCFCTENDGFCSKRWEEAEEAGRCTAGSCGRGGYGDGYRDRSGRRGSVFTADV